MTQPHLLALLLALLVSLPASVSSAQTATAKIAVGTVERIRVQGPSLQGNLSAEPAEREVSVYLPPSYATSPNRRYPVMYLLHGFTDDDDKWFGRVKHFISVPDVANQALSAAGARELLIVMPNAFTRYFGSMYSSSVTIGDWESFVAVDLVSAIDRRYRTLSTSASRGIAGHSMGGYGALRLAMKHPDIFSVVYALSPCCIQPTRIFDWQKTSAEKILGVEDLAAADFSTKAAVAGAAAWSPNPHRPPLFLDLIVKNGEINPQIEAKWHANGIVATVDQHIPRLRRLRAVAFDAGDKDVPSIVVDTRALSELLTSNAVTHRFETYPGNHVSGVAERLRTTVLPFFWQHLTF